MKSLDNINLIVTECNTQEADGDLFLQRLSYKSDLKVI